MYSRNEGLCYQLEMYLPLIQMLLNETPRKGSPHHRQYPHDLFVYNSLKFH